MPRNNRGAPPPSLLLSEHMAGWIAKGNLDPKQAETKGKGTGTLIEHDLTLVWEDGRAVLSKPSVPACVRGTVVAPILSRERLFAYGTFRLLVRDPTHVATWHMKYDLDLVDVTGQRRYRLFGEKTISGTGVYRPWRSATTLPFQVTRIPTLHSARRADDVHRASGVLHLSAGDLVRMLMSIDAQGAGRSAGLALVARFLLRFVTALLGVYGGPLDEGEAFVHSPDSTADDPDQKAKGTTEPVDQPPTLPEPTVLCCGGSPDEPSWRRLAPGAAVAGDAWLKLTRYAHPADGAEQPRQVMLAHAFAMSARCYITDFEGASLRTNLATTLYREGYDVWLFDYRASIDLPSSASQFDLDDIASRDWPTAVAKVLEMSGAEQVDVFAHCIGSATFLMAMLGGHLDGRVRAAVCSQAGIFWQTSLVCLVRSYIPFGPLLEKLEIRRLQPFSSGTPSNVLADLLLRLIPVPRGERCQLAICRWLNAVYAMSYRHAQLDDATHDHLGDLIKRGNLEALEHINLILRRGQLVDHCGGDAYVTPSGAHHLENVPVLLLQGDDNYLFKPIGSFMTREWLERHNQAGIYKRAVLQGYAHLDVILGRTADDDIFPRITAFFRATKQQLIEDTKEQLVEQPRHMPIRPTAKTTPVP